jgi:hypothetical protein
MHIATAAISWLVRAAAVVCVQKHKESKGFFCTFAAPKYKV